MPGALTLCRSLEDPDYSSTRIRVYEQLTPTMINRMPDWSPAQPLPANWIQPSLGFDGKGRVRVAYAELLSVEPLSTRIAIAERRAGAWVDVFQKVSAPGDIPAGINLAVGTDGTAAATYSSITGIDPATSQIGHYATYCPAGSSTWETPTEMVPMSGQSEFVRNRLVRVARNGVAVVLADRFDAGAGSLVISSHAPGGQWTVPQQLSPAGTLWGSVGFGINSVGDATVAWGHRYQAEPKKTSIRVQTRKASNGVLAPSVALTKEDGQTDSNAMRLDVNASGVAVLGTQINAQANVTTRDQNGTWQPFTPLFTDATAASSSFQAVGISPSGLSYALLWRQGPQVSSNDVICAARRGTFNSWGNAKPISAMSMESFDGDIAFRGDDAMLVYTGGIDALGGNPGVGVFQAVSWPSFANDPQSPVDLAEQGPRYSFDYVISDNVGSVIVVQTVYDATSGHAYTTSFDATPPEIVDANVPATAAVNQIVQARSKWADLWSPMGAITWDFGDGSPVVPGATVTHSWPAPGPYTVTLTGRDARGNSTSKTFDITIA
jgi:hypothetical protein